MNVIQRPGAREFSATMTEYVIDTDNTITFEVKYKGQTILSEEYAPDARFQVRIRQLGRFCALALWGEWSSENVKYQDSIAGEFTFLVDGAIDQTTFVMFSRLKTKKSAADPGWLTEIRQKVTRAGIFEYASALLSSADKVTVTAKAVTGATGSVTLYTHAGGQQVVTLDVSPDRITGLFTLGDLQSYEVIAGGHALRFLVDQNSYDDMYQFRCKNVYDVPETVTTVGPVTIKGNSESESAGVYGIERKFAVTVTDEYTANSGTIFLQSDYKLWHNFINAQENSVWQDGAWLPVVITKQTFEREFSRSALKEVEFSFRMADPEQNNMIEV